METGAKQHIVPQQMIRRFANDRNELRALQKATLKILNRPVGPKGILWKKNYYKDGADDLDAEWLTPIEQRFAKHYPKLADEPWSDAVASKEEGEAFIDWTISQLCRTQLLPKATERVAENKDPILQLAYALRPTLFQNEIRRGFFEHLKEVYTQPLWKWGCSVLSDESSLVLTDHPVCSTAANSDLGHVIFVPLSKKRVIFGGNVESLKQVSQLPLLNVNCILASWAEEWIYGPDESVLNTIARELRGEGMITNSAWLERARKPLFGLPERELPTDSSGIFEEMKREYGFKGDSIPQVN